MLTTVTTACRSIQLPQSTQTTSCTLSLSENSLQWYVRLAIILALVVVVVVAVVAATVIVVHFLEIKFESHSTLLCFKKSSVFKCGPISVLEYIVFQSTDMGQKLLIFG